MRIPPRASPLWRQVDLKEQRTGPRQGSSAGSDTRGGVCCLSFWHNSVFQPFPIIPTLYFADLSGLGEWIHLLAPGMECEKSESESPCPILCKSMCIAHQPPLSMGFSRQEYWSALPFLSRGDLLDPGIKPKSPTLQADSSPSEPPGKPWSIRRRG